MNRRQFLAAGGAAVAYTMTIPGMAWAQGAYPSRPVQFVVGFAPGGNSDVIARRFADLLGKQLGQPVVVDNTPGAGGAIASGEVARAPADGHTLQLASASTHVTAPLTGKDVSFDPIKDFTHIRLLTLQPWAIVVNPQVPANTLAELIDLIKAKPNEYFYGSGGVGGLAHLTGELFKKLAGGLQIEHIGYQGGAPALQDIVAGRLQMMVEVIGAVLPYQKSGQLKILAVCSEKKLASHPDLAVAVETVPGLVSETFLGISAPKDLPDDIRAKLFEASGAAISDKKFMSELQAVATNPVTETTPDAMTKHIENELAKWKPIVDSLS